MKFRSLKAVAALTARPSDTPVFKADAAIHTVIKIIFAVLFTCVTALVLFAKTDYRLKKEFLFSNLTAAACLCLLFAVFMLLYRLLKARQPLPARLSALSIDRIVLCCTVLLLLWQCYMTYSIFFLSGWDAETVRLVAEAIVNGVRGEALDVEYFSIYPNNLFITYFYAVILKLNRAVGIFRGEYATMSIVVINCFINAVSCLLVYKTTALLTRKRFALFGWCLAVLTFGLSPWSVICYSDTLALFAPILTVYLYFRPCKSRYAAIACRLAAAVTAVVCYFIKPQCAIPLIAIVGIEAARLIKSCTVKRAAKPIALCMAALLTLCCTNTLLAYGNRRAQLEPDAEKKLGVSHFLMMGLNEAAEGFFSQSDVDFSRSFATSAERTAANFREIKHRLQTMRLTGLTKHLSKKLLGAFGDGTFAWSSEGHFYKYVPESINETAAPRLRSFYHKDGENHLLLSSAQQLVWIAVLLLTAASAAASGESNRRTALSVLWLTLSGLIVYELLFEVRARYVYIFVPIFCVTAAIGFESAVKAFSRIIDRLKTIRTERV